MSSLSTINDDVIREIGFCLLHDKATLCALALTSRHLNKLTHTLIFHTIEVWVQGGPLLGVESDKFYKLMRTLESEPDLGSSIKVLQLKWSDDREWQNVDRKAGNGRAEKLLSYTPNIQSLEIQNESPICSPFTLSLNFIRKFNSLKDIALSDSKLNIHELTQYMQIIPLRSLVVHCMCNQTLPMSQGFLEPSTSFGPSQVRKVCLPEKTHIDPLIVNYLLKNAPNIEIFSANLPGLQAPKRPMSRHRQRELRMLQELSPARILTCLQPCQETLVELDLYDKGVRWPAHDGSRFDLSGFKSLKKLSLCSVCMFAPGDLWARRNGICDLLPKSIENININFDFPDGFLYPSFEIGSLFQNKPDKRLVLASISPERHYWLTELVDHADLTPNLRSLLITERLMESLASMWWPLEWEPPKSLKENIEHLGWDIRASVRVPRDQIVFA